MDNTWYLKLPNAENLVYKFITYQFLLEHFLKLDEATRSTALITWYETDEEKNDDINHAILSS